METELTEQREIRREINRIWADKFLNELELSGYCNIHMMELFEDESNHLKNNTESSENTEVTLPIIRIW